MEKEMSLSLRGEFFDEAVKPLKNGLRGVAYRVDGRGIVTMDADCAGMDKMLPEPPRQLAPYEEGMNRGFSD